MPCTCRIALVIITFKEFGAQLNTLLDQPKDANDPQLQMIIYLQMTIIPQVLIFVMCLHGFSFMEMPLYVLEMWHSTAQVHPLSDITLFSRHDSTQSLQAEGKYPPWVRAVYGSYPGPSAVGVQGQMQLG